MASELLASWLLTVALHVGVLLVVAWIIDRGTLRARPAWREMLWRAALFGGGVTASLQVLLDAPLPARIELETRAAIPVAAVKGESTLAAPVVAASRADVQSNAQSKTEQATPPHSTTLPVVAAPSAHVSKIEKALRAVPPWPLLLIAGWLAGALIALARVLVAWIRLERSLADAEPLASSALETDATALAIQAGIAAPRLALLDDLASPIAARGRLIVLPRWAAELLDREQLRAMLAHETAHIARRDPAWKYAVAIWNALLWPIPLVALARRRLDEIAEISCDAWAAIHLGDGRSLAECLAECAERRAGAFDPMLASAMAARESPLLRRIDYLIAGAPMNTQRAGLGAGFAAAAALAVAAFALPGVSLHAMSAPPAPPAPPAAPAAPKAPAVHAKGSARHVHITSDDDGHDMMVVQVSDDDHNSYNVKVDGKITFNDSEDDIATLSSGGSASFSETHGGDTRRVEIANRGGTLERRYFVDDKEQPVDGATHDWMAKLIPMVIRETAIDAEGRVKRLRAKGGAGAVLDEIAHIQSGYARGVYLRCLAASGKLSEAEMTRALGFVDGIDSDYEKRNALVGLAAVQPLDAAQQKLVMAQAGKIGSDYERAELLVGILPQLAPASDVRVAWLNAANGIGSDYEHRRTLTAMLDAGVADETALATVVDASRTIGSDYERRTLLTAVIERTHDAERLAPAYGAAAAGIGSAYERREALTALIRAPGFGKVGARAVLDAAAGIDGDYDCREVLVDLARVMPNDPDLIARYREIAKNLGSYDRGEAERALDRFAAR